MADSAERHHKTVMVGLGTIQQSARSLLDHATREDVPTGMTPRKRVWEYVDKWELTKSRDVILHSRGKGTASANTTPVSAVFSLPEESEDEANGEDEVEDEDDEDVTATISPVALASGTTRPPTPPMVSLSSSTSSTATLPVSQQPPPMPPCPVLKKSGFMKSGLPTMGALVDRPTNILGPRGSRRIR
jgi:kinesin family protein 11